MLAVVISTPQKHRLRLAAVRVGILQPVSHILYFHARCARSKRCSSKSASLQRGRMSAHAASKSARAFSKVGATPWCSDAAMRERKEPVVPAPPFDILRDARTLADPSDFDVAIENAPTLAVGVPIAAACEGGHRP